MINPFPQFRLGIVGLVLCHFSGVCGAADEKAIDFSSLATAARAELAETNTPGAVLTIIRGNRVIFARGFGVASVERQTAVSPDMLFRLGSTTKMFTAAALVKLAEEGKVRLQEPIGKYVKGLYPKLERITSHQLLCHTAGLKTGAPWYGLHDDSALGQTVRAMKDDYIATEPGKGYVYSNPGYWLAGMVIEEVAGKPYADAMAELLFQPLGMTSTTFRPTLAMTYPFALGHQATGMEKPRVVRPLADNAATWPAGSMFSNVHDLARFVIAFMNDGQLEGKPVFSKSLITALATPHVVVPENKGHYGYGLHLAKFEGADLVEHGGNRLGFGSHIWMLPQHKTAVIVLGNKTGSSLPKTGKLALTIMMEGEKSNR
jgi:CubicO group peptidase (beta-lactamase class C family)